MNFDQCFSKHFPLLAQELEIMMSATKAMGIEFDNTLEEITLSNLGDDYNGNYEELAEGYLGALAMHVKLGNIKGFDLAELLATLNWSNEFNNDVLRLLHK